MGITKGLIEVTKLAAKHPQVTTAIMGTVLRPRTPNKTSYQTHSSTTPALTQPTTHNPVSPVGMATSAVLMGLSATGNTYNHTPTTGRDMALSFTAQILENPPMNQEALLKMGAGIAINAVKENPQLPQKALEQLENYAPTIAHTLKTHLNIPENITQDVISKAVEFGKSEQGEKFFYEATTKLLQFLAKKS